MPVRMADIVSLVCDRLEVTPEELRNGTRERHVADARAVVYYLARRHTRLSWRSIAKRSTGKDHMAAVRTYQRAMKSLGALAPVVLELERRMEGT